MSRCYDDDDLTEDICKDPSSQALNASADKIFLLLGGKSPTIIFL